MREIRQDFLLCKSQMADLELFCYLMADLELFCYFMADLELF